MFSSLKGLGFILLNFGGNGSVVGFVIRVYNVTLVAEKRLHSMRKLNKNILEILIQFTITILLEMLHHDTKTLKNNLVKDFTLKKNYCWSLKRQYL